MSQASQEAAEGQEAGPPLNEEQLAAAHADPAHAAVVLAAAGTGKTCLVARVAFLLRRQGTDPAGVLVLTFSRRAQQEFAARLARTCPEAAGVEVRTFHSLAYRLLREHHAEAGWPQPPTVLGDEARAMELIVDCLLWDRLAELRARLCAWLFLPGNTPWGQVAATAAARDPQQYTKCLQYAREGYEADGGAGVQPLAAGEGASGAAEEGAPPRQSLPARLQQLLLCELFHSLCHQHDPRAATDLPTPAELLAGCHHSAGRCLQWVEACGRRGTCPAAEAAALAARRARGSGRARGGGGAAEEAEQLARGAAAYAAELRRCGLVGLGELPRLACSLLRLGGQALAAARERWSAILVDEMQDTSGVQYELLTLLAGRGPTSAAAAAAATAAQEGEHASLPPPLPSLTAVGDPDQSIYSFMDSTPDIFNRFRLAFDAREHRLQQNYRSTAPICAFGSAVLAANRRAGTSDAGGPQSSGQLVAARGGACTPVAVRQYRGVEEEAAELARLIGRLHRREGVPLGDVAVLYRCITLQGAHPHEPLTRELERQGLPFTVVGRERVGQQEEVAGLLALCGCVANADDDTAFARVLGMRHLGLGRRVRGALQERRAAARLQGCQPPSLLACAEEVCTQAGLALTQQQAPCSPLQQQACSPSQPQLSPAAPLACGATPGEGAAAVGLDPGLNPGLHGEGEGLATLGQLLTLIGGLQREAGRLGVPALLRRALRDSGLYAWLLGRVEEADHASLPQQQQEGEKEGWEEEEGGLEQQGSPAPAVLGVAGAAGATSPAAVVAAEVEVGRLTPPLRELLRQAAAFEAERRARAGRPAAGAGSAEGPDSTGGSAEGPDSTGGSAEGPDSTGGSAEGPDSTGGAEGGGVEALQDFLARMALEGGESGEAAAAADSAAAAEQGEGAADGDAGGGSSKGSRGSSITISTIHAAKGLEWRVVLLPTLNEGYLPTKPRWGGEWGQEGEGGGRSCPVAAHYAEERRLLHVAATRARDRLYCSYVQPAPQDVAALREAGQAPMVCSRILAEAVRALRRRPRGCQAVLAFEGQLPEEAEDAWAEAQQEQLRQEQEQQQQDQQRHQHQQRPRNQQQQEQQQQDGWHAEEGAGKQDGSAAAAAAGARGGGGRGGAPLGDAINRQCGDLPRQSQADRVRGEMLKRRGVGAVHSSGAGAVHAGTQHAGQQASKRGRLGPAGRVVARPAAQP